MTNARPGRGPQRPGLARQGGRDQRGGRAGRVPVWVRGTDCQELARPLLAGRPGYGQGLMQARRPGPGRDPETSAHPPMTGGARP
jgi:hypothetical protein